MNNVGFSTGCFYKTQDGLSSEVINIFREMDHEVIEIMFHSVSDTPRFERLVPSDFSGFKFISLHAPIYRGKHQKVEYIKSLKAIESMHREIEFDLIILHPDMFDDFVLLKNFNLPYAVENMDSRKRSCQGVKDLEDIFNKIDASFVLDVNHVFTNDKTMALADELLKKFGSKLKEVHVSGFDTFHEPLFKTKQDFMLKVLGKVKVPVIIESGLNDIDEALKEYKYVKNNLS